MSLRMNSRSISLNSALPLMSTPIDRMKYIVNQSIEIFMSQMAAGRIRITSERSVQLQLGSILKSIGELMCILPSELFVVDMEVPFQYSAPLAKSNSKKALIDIVIQIKNVTDPDQSVKCALELKHFKKENHREPNNRYDAVADLKNIEAYVDSRHCSYGMFLLITDHLHYVSHTYSNDTADFNLSHGHSIQSGTPLVYRTGNYGDPITLNRDYVFGWRQAGSYYYLTHEVLPT